MDITKIAAAVLAVSLGMAQASPARADSVPGHAALDALPNCVDVSLHERCRLDLPNGDFNGREGDDFYHGTFSWGQLVPATHSMHAHLTPWTYLSEVDHSHLDKPALSTELLLRSPRDRVFQWMKLTPGRGMDTVFTLHAHIGSTGGTARAAIHIAVPEYGEHGLAATAESQSRSLGMPRRELVTSLTVPADSTAERIGFALAALDGSAGVVVDDVFIVRTPVGDALPELTPVW